MASGLLVRLPGQQGFSDTRVEGIRDKFPAPSLGEGSLLSNPTIEPIVVAVLVPAGFTFVMENYRTGIDQYL